MEIFCLSRSAQATKQQDMSHQYYRTQSVNGRLQTGDLCPPQGYALPVNGTEKVHRKPARSADLRKFCDTEWSTWALDTQSLEHESNTSPENIRYEGLQEHVGPDYTHRSMSQSHLPLKH